GSVGRGIPSQTWNFWGVLQQHIGASISWLKPGKIEQICTHHFKLEWKLFFKLECAIQFS
ncbi:MAG: hypothetical protein K9J34_01125, partial [Rhodoferax sp.]|nr:hypothetical protein [Rhodoferax sp.]